jgi:hypothetical protein
MTKLTFACRELTGTPRAVRLAVPVLGLPGDLEPRLANVLDAAAVIVTVPDLVPVEDVARLLALFCCMVHKVCIERKRRHVRTQDEK